MDRARLGPYEIRDKLGEGGMGEVYLAVDSRLGREVAIKVLPAEFAADPERLARFEQEARAAAALNHPNIAAVHDVGVDDGVHYIVQEYLRGQTLGEEIAARRMPLERALELGVEIAEALGAAHGAGIVHRDLKPANVFITEQGHAKVLDFGLAKLTDLTPIGSADEDRTRSPTMLGTVAGQVMGTAGYMAPEQVEGGNIDGRADIFAFGSVLYEMLTGARPFSGRSIMQTLDLIVHEDPAPLASQRPGLPRRLQWVLDKCLAKDPKRRYQDAEDLVVDLRWVATSGPEEAADASISAPVAPGSTRMGIPVPAALVAGLVLVVATALLASGWRGAPSVAAGPVMNLQFSLPPDVEFSSLGRHAVTIDRAGTMVAFTAGDQVWTRQLADTVSAPVRGTEDGGRAAALSPDGRDLAFWRDGEIHRVPVAGGTSLRIVPAQNPWGMRWLEDGWILYGQGPEGIWRVRAAGGEAEQLLAMPDGNLAYGPQILEDGRLLYTRRAVSSTWDEGEIVAQSLSGTAEPQVLVRGGRDGRWLAQGYLIYARGGDVLASRWGGSGGSDPGPSVPVNTGVQSGREITAAAHFDVSDSGTFVYIPGDAGSVLGLQLLWRSRDGTAELVPMEPFQVEGMALSADGTRIAVAQEDATGSQIWVYDVELGAGTQLTSQGYNAAPLWSSDNAWIYFVQAQVQGSFGDVYRVRADGSGTPEVVIAAAHDSAYRPEALSGDGRTLILDRARIDTNHVRGVFRYAIESGELELLVDSDPGEFNGRLSPDGRYLAYARRSSVGGSESRLQIRDLRSGATYAASADNASFSRWSSDGSELFYVREGDNTADWMMRISIGRGERLEIGRPRAVFSLSVSLGLQRDFYVSPDDQRFLFSELPSSVVATVRPEVRVVVNWIQQLRERALDR